MKRFHQIASIFFCASLFIISCNKGLVYEHTEKVDGASWNFDQPLEFDLDAKDTTKYYELFLEVTHSAEFGHENFYTRISTVFPDGEKLDDIVSIQLADNMGSWNGNCSSKTCSSSLILQDQFRFKQIGPHKIVMENYSREPLEGIESIELNLYSVEDY